MRTGRSEMDWGRSAADGSCCCEMAGRDLPARPVEGTPGRAARPLAAVPLIPSSSVPLVRRVSRTTLPRYARRVSAGASCPPRADCGRITPYSGGEAVHNPPHPLRAGNGSMRMRNLVFSVGFALSLVFAVSADGAGDSRCRHCNSKMYGPGCHHSATGKHEHRNDENACDWCGSRSYGPGCHHSPTGKHRHGPGAGKCVWCGSKSTGPGCHHSPTGRHEK